MISEGAAPLAIIGHLDLDIGHSETAIRTFARPPEGLAQVRLGPKIIPL